MATRGRLLSVFPHLEPQSDSMPMDSADGSTAEQLDRALRIVLIQFTLLSMNITGRIKTVKIMSRHLQKFLAPLLLDRKGLADEQTELLLWLTVIGYSCAQDGTENEEWFADRCGKLIDDCRLAQDPRSHSHASSDAEETLLGRLERVQQRYFYHEAVQRPRLKKLIDGTLTRSPEKLGDGILAQRVLPHVWRRGQVSEATGQCVETLPDPQWVGTRARMDSIRRNVTGETYELRQRVI